MRPGQSIRQTSVSSFVGALLGTALRRRGLGRPLALGLALVAIGGVLTMASALLDLREAAPTASRHGWPTAIAADLGEPAFGPVLVLPGRGESVSEHDLQATLARLKEGAFGVVFETVPRPVDATPAASTEAGARFVPVVSIDAARPPLRLDIMGLGVVRPGSAPVERHGGPLPEPAP